MGVVAGVSKACDIGEEDCCLMALKMDLKSFSFAFFSNSLILATLSCNAQSNGFL